MRGPVLYSTAHQLPTGLQPMHSYDQCGCSLAVLGISLDGRLAGPGIAKH